MAAAPPLVLGAPGGDGVTEAVVLPDRGMMLLSAKGRLDGREFDLIDGPDAAEAARRMTGQGDDAFGNLSFSFGGAVLLPFANRITGAVPGARVPLARNWGGKAPGAARYAMHGLILDAGAEALDAPSPLAVAGQVAAGDFGGRWPSTARVTVAWSLADGGLDLSVVTENLGDVPLPLGVGWHPWFRLPSGDRRQARLTVPARLRTEVFDYEAVLPTGRLLPVERTAYDFRDGRPLGDLYLDDCFTDLERDADGAVAVEIADPKAGLGVRLTTRSPLVKAVQVYAPPDRAVVVVEPQFNLADPFSDVWPAGADTGMATLAPGEHADYRVRLQILRP